MLSLYDGACIFILVLYPSCSIYLAVALIVIGRLVFKTFEEQLHLMAAQHLSRYSWFSHLRIHLLS